MWVLENRIPNWNALVTNFQNDTDITSTRQSSETVKLDTSLINLLTYWIIIYENMYQLSLISSHIHEHQTEGMLILLCSVLFGWTKHTHHICHTTFESCEHFKNFHTCQVDFCLAKTSFLLFVQNIYSKLAIISFHETRKGANTFICTKYLQ
jgi:hypothetical protein